MKTLVILSCLLSAAVAHAVYDPCYWYSDSEKQACYMQYTEQRQRDYEMRQEMLNRWRQMDYDSQQQMNRAQAEDQQLMFPNQRRQVQNSNWPYPGN